MDEQDSFERYKKHLEESNAMQEPLVRMPKHPMNGYMRFHLERTHQQLSKNPTLLFKDLTNQVAAEWKTLDNKKREIYRAQSEFRTKQRERLIEEFNRITKTNRVLTPYSKYFIKMFPIYQKECPDKTSGQISKLIGQEWKRLDLSKRQSYIDESRREKLVMDRSEVLPEHIEAYKESVKAYEDELHQEKQKIIRMYNIKKNSRKEQLQRRRELKRQRRRAERMEEWRKRTEQKSRRKRELEEARVKQRDERRQAKAEVESKRKEAKKAAREQQRRKNREEKEKLRQQQKEKRQQEGKNQSKSVPRKKTEEKSLNKKQPTQSRKSKSKSRDKTPKVLAKPATKKQESVRKSFHAAKRFATPASQPLAFPVVEPNTHVAPKKEAQVRSQSVQATPKNRTKSKAKTVPRLKIPAPRKAPAIKPKSVHKVSKKQQPRVENIKQQKKEPNNQKFKSISEIFSETSSKTPKVKRTKQIKKPVIKKSTNQQPEKRQTRKRIIKATDEDLPSVPKQKPKSKINSSKTSKKTGNRKSRLAR